MIHALPQQIESRRQTKTARPTSFLRSITGQIATAHCSSSVHHGSFHSFPTLVGIAQQVSALQFSSSVQLLAVQANTRRQSISLQVRPCQYSKASHYASNRASSYLDGSAHRAISAHDISRRQFIPHRYNSHRPTSRRQFIPPHTISSHHSTTQQTNPPRIISLRSITLLVAMPSHSISVQITSRRHYTPHQHITLLAVTSSRDISARHTPLLVANTSPLGPILVATPQRFIAVQGSKSKRNGSPHPTPRRQLMPAHSTSQRTTSRRHLKTLRHMARQISKSGRFTTIHGMSRRQDASAHTGALQSRSVLVGKTAHPKAFLVGTPLRFWPSQIISSLGI